MAILACDLVMSLAAGPFTDEQIREQELVMLEAYNDGDPEVAEARKWGVQESIDMVHMTRDNFNPHYASENLLRLKTASKSDAMLHFLISP